MRCKIWGFHSGDYEHAVFWDVAPCRSCMNRSFASIFRVEKSASEEPAWAGGCRLSYQMYVFDWWLSLQPPAHAGSSLADFSTLKMKAICSSETSVHTRSTGRHIPEDGILQCKCMFKCPGTRSSEPLDRLQTTAQAQYASQMFRGSVPRTVCCFSLLLSLDIDFNNYDILTLPKQW
jgi:hypothetical protein